MNLSRQAVVGWILAVVGFAGLLGFDLPTDTIEALINSIADDATELVSIIWGASLVFFRKIVTSPLATGLKGLFGVKEDV